MDIAVLGTGNVGSALGNGLSNAGHIVVFGSRAPEDKAGFSIPVKTLAEAARSADVIVNALPGATALTTLREIGADTLAGKLLVDVANALTETFELVYPNASLGALLQAEFPATTVVKTLNTVSAAVMANPGAIGPATVFISGNDATAKQLVSGLLTDLGWAEDSQFDLGDITSSRSTEHYIFLSISILTTLGTTSYGMRVVRE
jgi:hypothetical protein